MKNNAKKNPQRKTPYQTGSLVAHSLLVASNPLSIVAPDPPDPSPPVTTPMSTALALSPSESWRPNAVRAQSRVQSHSPSRPPSTPTAASGDGGGGGGGGGDGGREAITMRTNGTTCERWRSIAPIVRAMVGITRAPQMRRPRLESITRRIESACAAAVPKSLTFGCSCCCGRCCRSRCCC